MNRARTTSSIYLQRTNAQEQRDGEKDKKREKEKKNSY